ncbi:hypothetical protein A2U01_0030995 [Trifolium medium]|uniref:Uncharacterized protein n=1 Tax=Trifolium medium TaxID=97028 RepID=A0A392PDP7_9FABA|nr:hypothetical protein [Trifolium medium]
MQFSALYVKVERGTDKQVWKCFPERALHSSVVCRPIIGVFLYIRGDPLKPCERETLMEDDVER